jgi:hypothetical protein
MRVRDGRRCTMDIVLCGILLAASNITADGWLADGTHQKRSARWGGEEVNTGRLYIAIVARNSLDGGEVSRTRSRQHLGFAPGVVAITYPRVKTFSSDVLPQAPSPLHGTCQSVS